MDSVASMIHPVILCGGTGSRLWPISRQMFPKQFLPLMGDRTMLENTARRVSGPDFAAPFLVTNEEHRFIVAEQMRQCGVETAEIFLEPFGRNTAPAAALAALTIAAKSPEALMLLMPSDHVITDERAFIDAVHIAADAAYGGAIVTFGITADHAETGYGYIRAGEPITPASHVCHVDRFAEKPDRATAEAYVASGDYFWNSGIFLFQVKTFLEELERLQPAILDACRAALKGAKRDLDFCRIDAEAFGESPALSIDYAVMEHTALAAVVPVSMGWNDVGAWDALWSLGEKDADGNVVRGDVILEGAKNCYARSDDKLLTALVGVEDLIVVVTDDAVFVADRDHAQDVKAVVDRLKAAGRSEQMSHSTVYRPWGSYRSIDTGSRFQVKQISVTPGAKLSLQRHHHRAEHWIVVEGTALVTCGEKTFLLHENQSTYIPIGSVHRLENPGKIPLRLIEVQSGGYLGEDDIVRLEDTFGRV
jgi:mannose-1-phosphate guanylyltransferase / mannose-6-phosphate isomerase